VPEIDEWLRRRVRMCYWKQWRLVRTKVRHLLALGVGKRQAILTAISSKSYWRLSKTLATQADARPWPRTEAKHCEISCLTDEHLQKLVRRRISPAVRQRATDD
jgi:hypothetical protein